MKKNNDKKILPKLKNFDQVLKEASTSKVFQEAYYEELMRLRLASEIRNSRIQKQLTQKDLAEQANMPQSVIARIEGGKHTISLTTLNKIAIALGREIQLNPSTGGTLIYKNDSIPSVESPYFSSSENTNIIIKTSFDKHEK